MPKVSVILPSFNYENFVSEAIESVLAQSYRDWELVIVDDGSTDRSPEVIERYAQAYPGRIRVFYHEGRVNRGIVETYRLGIAQSRGEYTAFIESDDQWLPDNLEKKLAELEKDPHVAVAHSRVEMFGDEQAIRKLRIKYHWPRFRTAGVGGSAFEALGLLLRFNFVLTFSNFITRKRFLTDLNYTPPRGAWLDWWLVSQLSLRGKFYYVPDICVRWRIHPRSQNFTLLSRIDDFYESFQMRDNMLNLIKKRYAERPQDTPAAMRSGILKEFKSNDDGRWLQMVEVGTKWTLRKYLPSLWYEYLRNIFVNRQNRRVLARLDSVDPVKGWVFRSDERPIQLVELYSGRQLIAEMDTGEPRPDVALRYPDIYSASRCGFSTKLHPDWTKRRNILFFIARGSGGHWKLIAQKRFTPRRHILDGIQDTVSFLFLALSLQISRQRVKLRRTG